ncbi:MAG: UDP-N-acetylglucosamine 2-epimerase (non-hydrolyzing) [Myxococcota bacterium]
MSERLKVLTVVGARPQFIKHAVVSRLLRQRHDEILIHTGQHYDDAMSARIFRQLELAQPDENLEIHGGGHGDMTGRMLIALESRLTELRPDLVLVYGDTNSTLAGALAASKLGIRVAHVEAGLRSFNRRMPEEINRVLTDHLADLLFAPTAHAVELLSAEGITRGVHQTGDVMLDSVLHAQKRARDLVPLDGLRASLGLRPAEPFAVATLHRAENTDDPGRLSAMLAGLGALPITVVLPLHPRTKKIIDADPALVSLVTGSLRLVEPLGYLEMLRLVDASDLVLTDSGGLQKEAYFMGVRCVTLRDETEWTETIQAGANALAGADPQKIAALAQAALSKGKLPASAATEFGAGDAAERIVEILGR